MDTQAPTNVVVVSKRWDNPSITVGISADGITIHMLLEDFLSSLALQMGAQYGIVTTMALQKKLTAAAQQIRVEMHQSTTPAMAHHVAINS